MRRPGRFRVVLVRCRYAAYLSGFGRFAFRSVQGCSEATLVSALVSMVSASLSASRPKCRPEWPAFFSWQRQIVEGAIGRSSASPALLRVVPLRVSNSCSQVTSAFARRRSGVRIPSTPLEKIGVCGKTAKQRRVPCLLAKSLCSNAEGSRAKLIRDAWEACR